MSLFSGPQSCNRCSKLVAQYQTITFSGNFQMRVCPECAPKLAAELMRQKIPDIVLSKGEAQALLTPLTVAAENTQLEIARFEGRKITNNKVRLLLDNRIEGLNKILEAAHKIASR
jgi:hypothetical protein